MFWFDVPVDLHLKSLQYVGICVYIMHAVLIIKLYNFSCVFVIVWHMQARRGV